MKVYLYGYPEPNERILNDVTHAIIDEKVTTIKKGFFRKMPNLVSVVMGDNVKKIENSAFSECISLRFLRLSCTLDSIGNHAFFGCVSLEAVFVPNTLRKIGRWAFGGCSSLRLLVLTLPEPSSLEKHHENIGAEVIELTAIARSAKAAGSQYVYHKIELDDGEMIFDVTPESNQSVTYWLSSSLEIHYPLHKLCCDVRISPQRIIEFLKFNELEDREKIDTETPSTSIDLDTGRKHASPSRTMKSCDTLIGEILARLRAKAMILWRRARKRRDLKKLHLDHLLGRMTPLHILSTNPHAPADTFPLLLYMDMEAAITRDSYGMNALDYAVEYNVGGLIALVEALCMHRVSW